MTSPFTASEFVRLADIAESIDYGVTAPAVSNPDLPRMLRITDIQNGRVDWRTVPGCAIGTVEAERFALRCGDILFARTGATTGKTYLISECPKQSVFASYLIRARLRPKALPQYVYHYLNSAGYWAQIKAGASGTAQPGVNASKLSNLSLPLPELPVQIRIAAILDKAAEMRGKRVRVAQSLYDLRVSAFLHFFGDPVANERGWRTYKVGDLLSQLRTGTKCGPFGSALKKDEYVENGIPVWGIDNVLPNRFDEGRSLYITPDKFSQLTPYAVMPGDILISRAGTVGRMCVAQPTVAKSIIGTNLIRVALNTNQVAPEFFTALFTYFGSRFSNLKANGKDDAYSFMNTGALSQVRIPVPDIQLQRTYVDYASRVGNIESKLREDLAAIVDLQRNLAARAFSGAL